jgi:hypothetical protein
MLGWESHIKMDDKEISLNDVDWVNLYRIGTSGGAPVNILMSP